MPHSYSKDILAEILLDRILDLSVVDGGFLSVVKRKIVFGPDGSYTDVTPSTPFPVTGTFTPTAAGWSGFGQSTPAIVPVTDVSVTLLNANPLRLFARITNNSTQRIYIQYGINAVYGRGLPLGINGTLTITSDELFLGQINAITNTGSVDIDVIEGVL